MITDATPLVGTDAVREAAGDHPFVRMYVSEEADLRGYRLGDTVGWYGVGPWGPVCAGLGSATVAADLVTVLVDELGPVPAAHLPQAPLAQLAGRLPSRVGRYDEWDFLWTSMPPAAHPAEPAVVRLSEGDNGDITALLDADHPGTSTRPGRRRIRCWYGVRDGGRLVACGADSSRGIGVLTGLTVASDRRGQGLGAALTTAMTRALHGEFGVVALGVEPANVGAARLYRRLGFAGRLPLVSVFLDG
jgi:ribosomal protein S18 acetylase RimI-like enzyme